MNHRFLAPTVALANVVVAALMTQMPAAGQQAPAPAQTAAKAVAAKKTATPAAAKSVAARTPWGDPDLEGVYTFGTTTPIERPKALANKDHYTEEELAVLEKREAEKIAEEGKAPREGDTGTYNNFWVSSDKGKLTGRTSLITDPEDGRMPPFTPRAQKIRADWAAKDAARYVGKPPYVKEYFNSWEDHPIYTRCIARAMPRMFQSYNHGVQILQSPGYVILDYESMHDVRIIPLDGSPHLDSNIRQYDGDSRGHWEGNTLVVDLANLSDKMEFPDHVPGAPQGNMHIIERFTRVDSKTIDYQVTVTDSTTWTRPWTFDLPWRADDPSYQQPEDLYEYACHEGNYGMMEDTVAGTQALKAEAQRLSAK